MKIKNITLSTGNELFFVYFDGTQAELDKAIEEEKVIKFEGTDGSVININAAFICCYFI